MTADIGSLSARVGEGNLVTDPLAMERFLHDEATGAPFEPALAMLRPRTTWQVREAVAWCIENQVPIVPRGAGTGLSGGANSLAGSLIVSFDKMDQILEVDPVERTATVQPGVVNDALRARVAQDGLWYPPDPASSPWSTLGGNVATNAGGLACVKYGVTSEYVLALEVVNGLAQVVRVGKRTAKDVAGLDLRGLYVGSEGALGLITEIKVKLLPLPADDRVIVGYFNSLIDAGEAVANVTRAGIIPSALELVDKRTLQAVDDWKNMGLSAEAEAILLARADSPGQTGEAEAAGIAQAFDDAGASFSAISEDADEAEAFFAARRLAHQAMERVGHSLSEDVVVPRQRLPEVLKTIQDIAKRNEITVATVAHAGDGNLHPTICTPYGDEAAQERANVAFEEILQTAIDAGGTVTGEHGVGLLKMAGLTRMLSPEVSDMHRAVKNALDPHGIMNPGKMFAAE